MYHSTAQRYILLLSNVKDEKRKGKVQLINASSDSFYKKMHKPIGDKSNELTTQHMESIQKLYFDFEDNDHSKIFPNEEFGYYKITVNQPERDENGHIILDTKGK